MNKERNSFAHRNVTLSVLNRFSLTYKWFKMLIINSDIVYDRKLEVFG